MCNEAILLIAIGLHVVVTVGVICLWRVICRLKNKKRIMEKQHKEEFKKIVEMPVIVRDNSNPSGLKVVVPFSGDCFRRTKADDNSLSFLWWNDESKNIK